MFNGMCKEWWWPESAKWFVYIFIKMLKSFNSTSKRLIINVNLFTYIFNI